MVNYYKPEHTKVYGERNGRSKLTEQQVRAIRKEYVPRKNGGYAKLAEKYGVSMSNIRYIVQRKSWPKVNGADNDST